MLKYSFLEERIVLQSFYSVAPTFSLPIHVKQYYYGQENTRKAVVAAIHYGHMSHDFFLTN